MADLSGSITPGINLAGTISTPVSSSGGSVSGSNFTGQITGGPMGPQGYTPVKGVDYNDGEPGRNPLTVSNTAPDNPQQGDLWYEP